MTILVCLYLAGRECHCASRGLLLTQMLSLASESVYSCWQSLLCLNCTARAERAGKCRLGGAKVLLVGVALWSFGTLLAPPAAHISLLALCATRAFVCPSY